MEHRVAGKGMGGLFAKLALSGAVMAMTACGEPASADAVETTVAQSGGTAGAGSNARTSAAATTMPPAALASWESYAKKQCSSVGERFATIKFVPLPDGAENIDPLAEVLSARRGAFVTGDFNADGKLDYVVTSPEFGCASDGPGFDDRGAPIDFIVSTPAGFAAYAGFNGWLARDYITRRGDRDVLEYPGGFNGSCGTVAAVFWGWNGSKIDVVERHDERGTKVDKDGCAVGNQAAAPAASGKFPPVPKGYYAIDTTCARATDAEAAANGPGELAVLNETALNWFDDGRDIKGFEALGNGRFRVRAVAYGNGDGKAYPDDFIIRVSGPGSFVHEGKGQTFSHCPANTIPAAIRSWFEG